jgi:hypothetical protein
MNNARASLSGLCLILISGCTHVKTLDGPAYDYLQHINNQARGQTVIVHYGTREQTRATHLEMGPDATSWVDVYTGRQQSLPTRSIREVRVLDRIGGLIDGMSVGLAIGASVGALTGSSGDMADYENRNAKAAGGAFVGGMLMGGFGMLLGSSRGAKQCYRFRWDGGAGNTPAPPPSKPLVTY